MGGPKINLNYSLPFIQRLDLWDKAQGEWIKFNLWPRQIEFIDVLQTEQFVLVLKKRQVGMSQLTGADNLIQCLTRENFTVLILSITADDASVYLDRVRKMYARIPTMKEFHRNAKTGIYNEMDAKLIMAKHLNKCVKGAERGEEMHFASGSTIVSLSAQKGRGRTADRVVIDEAAHIQKDSSHITLDEVLMGIEPTLERSGGQLILITTAKGMNLFHEYWKKAAYGRNSFFAFFFSCYDDPTFTKESRDIKIRDHGIDHVRQEYPATAEESFLASGSPRFDTQKLIDYPTIEPVKVGELVELANEYRITSGGDNFKKYRSYHPRAQYLITGDISEGLAKGDYTHYRILDFEDWGLVAEWHGHIDHRAGGKLLAMLGRCYNNALLIPEANNHGASTISMVREDDYPEDQIFVGKFLQTKPDDDYKDPEKRYGWFTTLKTKKVMINYLAYAIDEKLIPALTKEDVSELMTYILDREGKTNAEEGCFDDRVISLAIAIYLLGLDSFWTQYAPRQHSASENCDNCKYNNKANVRDSFGLCSASKRFTRDDQICPLYRETIHSFAPKVKSGRFR